MGTEALDLRAVMRELPSRRDPAMAEGTGSATCTCRLPIIGPDPRRSTRGAVSAST